MTTPWVVVAGIAIFAVVAIVAILRYPQLKRLGLHGPGGLGMNLEGANEKQDRRGGAHIEHVESRGGGVAATDTTGAGASVRNAKAEKDITASSSSDGPGPKA